MQGLLRGPALAVDGGPGHLFGQPGRQPAGAGDVAGLGPDGVHAAEVHVLDGEGVDVVALDEGGQDVGAEIGGMDLGKPRRPLRPTGVRMASTM